MQRADSDDEPLSQLLQKQEVVKRCSCHCCELYKHQGYLYCFSNESMPGILKIGMTERTPIIRLDEANGSDTWRPPTPYKIEYAKKVFYPKDKEKKLHTLLAKYTDHINPKREFFRVALDEVLPFMDLMDGNVWDTQDIPGCAMADLPEEKRYYESFVNYNMVEDPSSMTKDVVIVETFKSWWKEQYGNTPPRTRDLFTYLTQLYTNHSSISRTKTGWVGIRLQQGEGIDI